MLKQIMVMSCLLMPLKADMIKELIPKLIRVESNNNLTAIGDNGKAKGQLQIWKVVVDDVNRIYKTNYKHDDMFTKKASEDVCYKYLSYWSKHYKKTTRKPVTNKVLAQLWNGGSKGYKKPSTLKYWNKVKEL